MFTLFGCCLSVIIKAKQIQTTPVIVAIVLIVFLIILIVVIGFLFMYHIYLISTQQLTNEYSKMKSISTLNEGCFFNFLHRFCKSEKPKYPKHKPQNKPQNKPQTTINLDNQIHNLYPITKNLTNDSNRINKEIKVFNDLPIQNQIQTVTSLVRNQNDYSYFYSNIAPNSIDIDNLYIEGPFKTENKSSVKKALNIACKTANVSSF